MVIFTSRLVKFLIIEKMKIIKLTGCVIRTSVNWSSLPKTISFHEVFLFFLDMVLVPELSVNVT